MVEKNSGALRFSKMCNSKCNCEKCPGLRSLKGFLIRSGCCEVFKKLNRCVNDLHIAITSSFFFTFRCLEFGRPVLCYHQLKQCDTIRKLPIPTLCKRDCELFKESYCKDELSMINTTTGLLSLYIPDCNQLSNDNANCIPVKRKTIPPPPPQRQPASPSMVPLPPRKFIYLFICYIVVVFVSFLR